MPDHIYLWVIFGLFIIWDLLVTAARSAFLHARLTYLLSILENQPERVQKTIDLLEKPSVHAGLRLSNIVSHFMIAGSLTLALRISFPNLLIWQILLILAVGIFLISLLEVIVEKAQVKQAEGSALTWSSFVAVLDTLASPFTRLLIGILGENAARVSMPMTDETLRDWVEDEQPEGSLERGEREMIYSIFQFGDTIAREIMVPRADLLALDINTTISEARREFINAGHSRVPVYEDNIDNVVGLLYAKDLLAVVDGKDTIAQQRKLLRPAYFVPEAKKIDELFTEMQSKGVHMSLVVDEYGGVAGVVTLEDIVEEIVGEIRDEYDEAEETDVLKLDDDNYMLLGRVNIDEINEIFKLELPTDHADTLGGLIYSELGRVPQPGELVTFNSAEFTVEEVVARRILKVKLHLAHPIEDQVSEEVNDAD
ncbi:MAG TPA: hemolysin family protein [Anaerolineaceae bacterium]|nr:hemolysin family protein [Anaerolineaceae bacterium]